MSLDNYLAKSNAPYEEILNDFSHQDIEQLYLLLQEEGYAQHHKFVNQHLQDILQYISLSPSQRLQKKWINRPQYLWFRFAALQLSYATVQMLSDLHPISLVVNGGSYRSFHSIAANALAQAIFPHPLLYFPFAHHNPFYPKS